MNRTAYFEKICLRSPACEKAWIFERAVGYVLQVNKSLLIKFNYLNFRCTMCTLIIGSYAKLS